MSAFLMILEASCLHAFRASSCDAVLGSNLSNVLVLLTELTSFLVFKYNADGLICQVSPLFAAYELCEFP